MSAALAATGTLTTENPCKESQEVKTNHFAQVWLCHLPPSSYTMNFMNRVSNDIYVVREWGGFRKAIWARSILLIKRFIVRRSLLCFTYCRHLSLSVIHCKRISKRRTVIVASLLLSDFIMWISCPAAPALAKCSAKHQLRFRRPNFALLLTTISSTRAIQKETLGL